MEKELEKLKRQHENIQLRKTLATKGTIDDKSEEEKQREYEAKLKAELEDYGGAHVIAASPKKIQTMRHQAS